MTMLWQCFDNVVTMLWQCPPDGHFVSFHPYCFGHDLLDYSQDIRCAVHHVRKGWQKVAKKLVAAGCIYQLPIFDICYQNTSSTACAEKNYQLEHDFHQKHRHRRNVTGHHSFSQQKYISALKSKPCSNIILSWTTMFKAWTSSRLVGVAMFWHFAWITEAV